MINFNKLDVFHNKIKVGTLAIKDYISYFEYDDNWINTGFSISPFSLPLEKRVFKAKIDPFDGLFGVFNDSLPDGWGRLIVDRMLQSKKIDFNDNNILNRLAIVGDNGMGSLSYKPNIEFTKSFDNEDFDQINLECQKILNTEYCDNLDYLFTIAGSSGGAKPKILTLIDNEDWIIKFPSSYDQPNIGEIEYKYSLCAKRCGINMPDTRLFPSKTCSGYFGVKRFDRINNKKIHMVSASGLLETSHRIPNLDYNTLTKLTFKLTNSFDEVKKLFALMCFNVFAHNRDDHSKNFSFIYDEDTKRWLLSPAYDLTYSNSIGNEHATTINSNGKNPSLDDLLSVATNIGMDRSKAKEIALDIKDKVEKDLSSFL